MWTAEEFAKVLERHPDGGTLWTRTHRTVRYIRVLRPDEKTTVAIMTELWVWKHAPENERAKVELFVQTPEGIQVSELHQSVKTPEFLARIIDNPILSSINPTLRAQVNAFLSTPDNTVLNTW